MRKLAEWIRYLEENDQLLRIKRQVDPCFEAAAVIQKIQRTVNKAVIFENIRGFSFPMVSNILGTYQRTAMVLGCPLGSLNETWNSKSGMTGLFPAALAAEGQDDYTECRLRQVPVLTYREKDAGPYITAGVVCVRDPETGIANLSFHRMQVIDDNKLRIRITPGNHLGICVEKAASLNKGLAVAVLIGGHPALMLAGASRIPMHQDELDFAGALMGEGLKLQKCKTIDLSVPAGVDFIIEGSILPDVMEDEGPFGDFLGYYVPVRKNLVLQISHVSRLTDCCGYGILSGSPEQDVLAGVPVAANIYKHVKEAVPAVMDVTCMPTLYHSVVKMKQQFPGQARQAALAALACDPSQTKFCTVVDEDVDIYDPLDVQWATITRCRADRDIIIVPDVPSIRYDPYSVYWSKMGIDATKPFSESAAWEFERTRIPGIEGIDLQDYL